MLCPVCQTENAPTAKFCSECGTRLGGAKTFAPASPPASLESLITPSLAAKLEDARLNRTMQGERRIVTMLFSDVKGSTAAAGQVDPEEWAEIMNGAFEQMIRPIYKYEGTVARLMGDAILAFFGAPIAREDDPQRAVLAGLEIVAGFGSYREKVSEKWKLEIDVRVGINTGLVMVGQVGSDLQMEYTALGDAINLAARMEQTAVPGTVQVSEATHRLVAPVFEWEDLGEIEVKGKDADLHTYRPLRVSSQPGSLRGLVGHGIRSPLIGREAEFAILEKRLGALQKGSGSAVMVIGEAGVGKSRLISEFRALVSGLDGDQAPRWLEGYAISYRQTSSYFIWRQVIRRAIGAAEGDGPDEVRAKLEKLHEQQTLSTDERQYLEVLLAVESPATLDSLQNVSGETLVRNLVQSTQSLLGALTAETPVILVLDDLHWADRASLDLLRDLIGLAARLPLLILGLTRPDSEAEITKLRNEFRDAAGIVYEEIEVSPLSPQSSRTLLENLLAMNGLPERLRQLILERTEGNPFYVEEMVRALVDSGAVKREVDRDGTVRWTAEEGLGNLQIPENLQSLLTARIDRLEDEARHTLQLASVIGRSFFYRVLDRINQSVAAVQAELTAQIRALQQAEMILESARIPEIEYVFKHALTQEAAYNTILLRLRREYHRRAGEAIEALFADRLEEFYPVLARHFGEADDARAIRYGVLAGDSAFRLYAIPEAASHYSRALAIAKRDAISPNELQHMFTRLGRCYELQARHEDAVRTYEEMAELARQKGSESMELEALIGLGTILGIPTPQQDPERARAISESALSLARRLNDREAEARIQWNKLLSYMYSGRMDLGIPFGEQAAELAHELGMQELLAYSLQDLALAYMAVGDFGNSRQRFREARLIWEALNNLPMLAENWSNSGLERLLTGALEEASLDFDRGFEIAQRIDNLWGQANARIFFSETLLARGEMDLAFESQRTFLPIAQDVGHPGSTLLKIHQALTYAHLGAIEQAGRTALDTLRNSASFAPFHAYALAAAARYLILQGDLSEAERLLQRKVEVQGQNKTIFEIEAVTRLVDIEFAAARSELNKALEAMGLLLEWLVRSGARYFLPETLFLKSRLLLAVSRDEEAEGVLLEAREIALEIGFRTYLWRILAKLARLAEERGDRDAGAKYREEAYPVVDFIVAHTSDPELRGTFGRLVESEGLRYPIQNDSRSTG